MARCEKLVKAPRVDAERGEMKIQRLKVQNYRTLENVEITFASYYCAICGKNNLGKTNLLTPA